MDNCVYVLRNKVNGKEYVGKTNNLERRIYQHKNFQNYNQKKYAIHKAIEKYGWKNFEVLIIDKNLSKVEAFDKEILEIEKRNTYKDGGYNMTKGGEDPPDTTKYSEDDLYNALEYFRLNRGVTKREAAKKYNVSERQLSHIHKKESRVEILERFNENYPDWKSKHGCRADLIEKWLESDKTQREISSNSDFSRSGLFGLLYDPNNFKNFWNWIYQNRAKLYQRLENTYPEAVSEASIK